MCYQRVYLKIWPKLRPFEALETLNERRIIGKVLSKLLKNAGFSKLFVEKKQSKKWNATEKNSRWWNTYNLFPFGQSLLIKSMQSSGNLEAPY